MKPIRIAFALMLAATVAVSAAQRQGRGNRGGVLVQTVLDNITAQSDPLVLIFRKDVQHDLGLDLGQRNKLDNFNDRQQSDLAEARQQNRRNNAAVLDLVAKQKKDAQAKVDELLTDQQKQRLNQVSLQIQGNAILYTGEIQKKLGITDEQRMRISQVQSQRQTLIAELQNNAAQGGLRPQDINDQILEIIKETNNSLGDILTQEQTEAMKKMLGRPFKAG